MRTSGGEVHRPAGTDELPAAGGELAVVDRGARGGPPTAPLDENSYAQLDGIGFLFASIANLTTGAVVGVEMVPRPRYPGFADVLAAVSRGARRTMLDVGLAAAGLRWSAEAGVRLPVHLNLLADTAANSPEVLDELHAAVEQTRYNPAQVVLEIGSGETDPRALLAGARQLRERGYRLLVDELEPHDPRLSLILELAPEQVKLHPRFVAGLTEEAVLRALVDAARLCRGVGAEVVADGITTSAQLEVLRAQGIRRGQGTLLAMPSRRPLTQPILALSGAPSVAAAAPICSATLAAAPATDAVGGFARAVTTMPVDATGGEVREVFRDAPTVTAVVLVDEARRPVATLDRNRFMLEISGPYGHALRAGRPVRPLADEPKVLSVATNARAALDLLAHGDPQRRNDDIVIVDRQGRCVGIAHVADLLRGAAELAHERALALHPATRLGGVAVLGGAISRRVSKWSDFAVGWLAPQLGPLVERSGLGAAENAQRLLAESVKTALGEPGDNTGDDDVVVHVLDGLVVLTQEDRVHAVDRVVRRLLREHNGPALCSAWLLCGSGQVSEADEVEGLLARLLTRARSLGPHTALTATPDTLGEPRPLSAFPLGLGNPA